MVKFCRSYTFHCKLADYRENGNEYKGNIFMLQEKIKAKKNHNQVIQWARAIQMDQKGFK